VRRIKADIKIEPPPRYTLRVVGSVEVVNGNMEEKNSVEVYEEVSKSTVFGNSLRQW
jgi:hypothetical protein